MLLNDRLGLSLNRHDVDELVARTEGWPAGLYLAALSLRGSTDSHDFVAKFGGEHRHVVDFLIPEVLEAHDARFQELMLHCSALGLMSVRLLMPEFTSRAAAICCAPCRERICS